MENGSPPHDLSNCDLKTLPEIISWPSLRSQAESIDKLSEMGASPTTYVVLIILKRSACTASGCWHKHNGHNT